jgi:glycosyltransferase involved in cell wall biosynthesis
MNDYTIGFILEQTLGHITHSENLQTNILRDREVQACWAMVSQDGGSLAGQMPIFRNWTVRAGLRTRRALVNMTRRARLDALFFHTQVTAILATDWLRRIPSVVSLDATPWQYDELGQFYRHGRSPLWLERVKWQLNRDCFRAARGLVTWSHWAKRGLVADYEVPADKVTVIPPGVNSAEWARPRTRTRHDGPIKILFVGGNLERKGGKLLLEAFRAVRPLGAELHMVTHDALPLEPGLFGYRRMQPNSDALKQLFHDCDVFCLPSYGDCLPMVLSEAGAAGLPSVATPVGAIPEVVRDGETGMLIPVGDATALTDALRRLVLDGALRLRMGERAADLVAREYDARRNAARLLDLLKQIADMPQVESWGARWQEYS